MTEPSPLAPPAPAEPVLTLTAPEPPKPVAATSAPKLAPAVPAAALPGLDQKVDAYLAGAARHGQPNSPEFTAKANDVRTMGDDEIRRGRPRRSNRCSQTPVKALQEGGLSEGIEGRRHPARAAPHGRGPRPQGRPGRPEDPRHDPHSGTG